MLKAANALEEAKQEAAAARRELAASKEATAAAQTQAGRAAEELRGAREAAAKVEAHFDKARGTSAFFFFFQRRASECGFFIFVSSYIHPVVSTRSK